MRRLALVMAISFLAACASEPAPSRDVLPAAAAPPPPPATATPPTATTTTPPATPTPEAGAPKPICPPGATAKPGETTETITVGGLARTFIVHVPPGYSGTAPVPLVLDFHPLSVSASLWKVATGWANVADDKGFVLVWPQGIGDSWNVGRCCGQAHDQNVDDVAFARAIVAKLESEACIDDKHVYATGASNGGGMTFRLACDAADLFAAAAPVDFDCITGPTNAPSCASCNPSRPISITQFRGTSDSSVPYGGGPTSVVPGLEFPGAQASFADWGAKNACTGTPTAPPGHPTCSTYPACGAGTQTTLCTIPYGTHCTSYIPFGIPNVAWEAFAKEALP